MLVAVFADAHAHGDALDAVLAAAVASGVQQIWSLGDTLGGGPDPERALAATRELCSVALVGNHDYGATGSVEPSRLGPVAARSIELAQERLSVDDIAWVRSRKPAARRGDVRCWHGSPRNPVAGDARQPGASRRHRHGRPTRHLGGQVAPEPGRGRCSDTVGAQLVGRPRRASRRGCAVAPARPRRVDGDVASHSVRSGPRAPPRRSARARG